MKSEDTLTLSFLFNENQLSDVTIKFTKDQDMELFRFQ